MFIAIIGTQSSGCTTVENYLVASKGFTSIRLSGEPDTDEVSDDTLTFNYRPPTNKAARHLSFLTLDATPLSSPSPYTNGSDNNDSTNKSIYFTSPPEVLEYITRNWRTHFVTTDLKTRQVIELFTKRPTFFLLGLDAPLVERYRRSSSTGSFQAFVEQDDEQRFGSLRSLSELINLHVVNDFPSVLALETHIESLDLLNPLHLRPDWDMYFMTLASLASKRSNCMKRRVGAILVRDKRIVSTGYNGTPRGVRNCNEGGCPRCNDGTSVDEECVCLHAEENALLEAGRERVGKGSVLYCNTCPCLKCTVKIIQTGVECVVYNLSYKVDFSSAKLFAEAGVQLRRFDPAKQRLSTPTLPKEDPENYDTSTIDMNGSDEDSPILG